MPTVPTYVPGSGSNQTVTSQGQASPDSFGAAQDSQITQAGQAGMGLGVDLLNQATQQQDMVNRAKVRDVLSQSENSAMDYVTDNVLSKKGVDAIGSMPQTQTDLKAQQSSFADQLDNPAQKQMFSQLYPAVYNHASQMARRHVMQQTLAYNQDTLTASKAAAVNTAVTDYNDPKSIANAEMVITADNNSLYHGMPAQGAQQTQSEISTLHTNIANAMAQNDPAAAASYIRTNQAKILPAQFETLNKSINEQVVNAGATKTANTLSQLNQPDAMAQANAIADPVQKQLVIDQLNTHFSAKTSAQALSDANDDATNLSTVLSDPGNAAANLPANMTPAARTALVQAANDRLTATTNGQPVVTNPQVYSSLVKQAATDPDGFLRRPLTPYLSQLSNNDWADVTSIRNDLAKKREGADGKAFQLASVDDVFNSTIKGVPELSMNPKDDPTLTPGWFSSATAAGNLQARTAQIANFKSDFQNRFNQQFPNPIDRTSDNAQTLLNGMLARQVVQKGWWRDTTAPAAMVQENPTLNRANFSTTMEPHTVNGTQYFYNYNSDRTTAKVFDANGKQVGTWPATK